MALRHVHSDCFVRLLMDVWNNMDSEVESRQRNGHAIQPNVIQRQQTTTKMTMFATHYIVATFIFMRLFVFHREIVNAIIVSGKLKVFRGK